MNRGGYGDNSYRLHIGKLRMVVTAELLRAIRDTHRVDELLQWLSPTIGQYFSVPIGVEVKRDIITYGISYSSQYNHDHGHSQDEQTRTARLEINLEGSQHDKQGDDYHRYCTNGGKCICAHRHKTPSFIRLITLP